LLDYLPPDTLVAIDERRQALAHGQQWFDHADEHHGQLALATLPGGLHRPPAEALAEAETRFAGFDLAELHESDNHPNSLDLAAREFAACLRSGTAAEGLAALSGRRDPAWTTSFSGWPELP
jgi:transcription-repair coupling factor (superfamily II helicase)